MSGCLVLLTPPGRKVVGDVLIEYVTEIRTFEYIVDTLVRRIDLSNPRASVSEARAYRHASPDPRWRI